MAPTANQDGEDAPPEPSVVVTKWTPTFEARLKQLAVDYDGEHDIRENMVRGMRKLFEKPYEMELGHLRACRRKESPKPLSTKDAQRVIFYPRPSDMQLYVDAFALDTRAKSARPSYLIKIKLLSVFYTLHKKDGTLLDRFIHYNGLDSLVRLLADESERKDVIHSQAVEMLLEILSPQMTMPASNSPRQAHIQHQVWSCLRSKPFWENFARIIADPADRFPKSHESCTRILAGAVGWLRPEERCIPEVAVEMPNFSEAADALRMYLQESSIRPDIRSMCEELAGELSSGPKVRGPPLQGDELKDVLEDLFDKNSMCREDSAHAWQSLRRLGNEAFKAGMIWPAEAAYGLAIEEGADVVPHREASLILSNRALMLLKAGHHADAARVAADALCKDPRNSKAAYRRALGLSEVLEAEQRSRDGNAPENVRRLIEEAADAAEVAATLEPNDSKVNELLQKSRERLLGLRSAAPAKDPIADVLDVNEMD